MEANIRTKHLISPCISILAIFQLISVARSATLSTEVEIAINPEHAQHIIAPDFAGLSYESSMLLADPSGRHYFSPDNLPLINIFKTLGIKNLRIGGAAVDDARFAVPNRNDIDSLFGFAHSASVKVIYSFRLKDGDLEATKATARYIADHYIQNLDCFTIGNEPNEYFPNYSKYIAAWTPYFDALSQQNPEVKFCGPSAWKEDWARQFADGLTDQQRVRIAYISQHVYAFGPADHVKDAATARGLLIGKKDYNGNYDKFAPEILNHGLQYRIEETNSYAHGGEHGASDAYVAALWSLDYLYWWAEHQAAGINFHTGEFAPGGRRGGFRYTAFVPSLDGYSARALSYGLLAFALGGQGQFIESNVVDEKPSIYPDLRTYAVRDADDAIFVTLINRSNGSSAMDARATISLPTSSKISSAREIALVAPAGDLTAETGITVGGCGISDSGKWAGKWDSIDISNDYNRIHLTVPAAAAVVLNIAGYRDTPSPTTAIR